jgi:predicted DNA-binding mobile mystery protein A
MKKMENLRIRQLDEALAPFSSLRDRPPPPTGWAKAIRQALGISLRQLSRRTGLSKTSISSAETGEAKGTVQLDTLRGLADALDCDLVYAIVPRSSLAQSLESQAIQKAANLVGRVAASMKLEAQGVADKDTERQVRELAATLLRDRGRGFWDV